MLSLYGSPGMGTSGAGVPTGGNMSMAQILAMLQQQGAAQPATPMQQGGAQTPMANYIGASAAGGGMGMQRPQMPGVQDPQPQGMAQGGQQGTQGLMQQIAMLQQMKNGQNGLTPQGGNQIGPMSGTGGAGSMMPAWLQAMLHSGSYGATGAGMAPGGGGNGMMVGGT